MNRSWLWSPVRACLATVFLLLPMVAWVASFDRADCDDKAGHWFSALYATADRTQRQEFREGIAPFVMAYESHPRWHRTAFRLQATDTYPLVNVLIAGFQRPGAFWLHSVKWSLLAAALLSVVVVAVVASRTPFGLWPALLTLNIVAWQVLPESVVPGPLPPWMMPFVSYAPRNSGSLLVIPAALALAAHRPRLVVAVLAAVFLWHTGLGLLLAPLVVAGALTSWPLTKRLDNFHDRALVASLAILGVGLALSALTNRPEVDRVVQALSGLDAPRQVHQRLIAADYCLFALAAVLAARRAGLLAMRSRLFSSFRRAPNPDAPGQAKRDLRVAGIVALLAAITLGHVSSLRQVVDRESGFFVTSCGASAPVELPEGWRGLTLYNEEQLFVSFGNYLLELRGPVGPQNSTVAAFYSD